MQAAIQPMPTFEDMIRLFQETLFSIQELSASRKHT